MPVTFLVGVAVILFLLLIKDLKEKPSKKVATKVRVNKMLFCMSMF